MDMEEPPPRPPLSDTLLSGTPFLYLRAIADSTNTFILISTLFISAISGAAVANQLVNSPIVCLGMSFAFSFVLGALLYATALLFFPVSASNHLTDMKDTPSVVHSQAARNRMVVNRLTYHPSPLTLAYNNITQATDSSPIPFNKEKFEAGLVGWSDYKHFVQNSALKSDVQQPFHTFMMPEYIALEDEQAIDRRLEADRQKHPRRYDRQPGTPTPWLWTGNVAKIIGDSSR